MKRKIRVFSSFVITLVMVLNVFTILPAVNVSAAAPPAPGGVYEGGLNPYIPLWDYNPDTDPHVFHDPDNPGKFRLYLFSSHDLNTTNYCYTNQVLWSAPVEDLTKWTYHGVIASQTITGSNAADTFFAPTACEVDNHDGTYTYYYMPFINGGNKATLMMKSSRPDGPYEVINWSNTAHSATSATAWGGSNNFDPALFVDDDGRMYGIWGGYSRAISGAELDPQNPQNVKAGTSVVQIAPLYSQTGGTDLSVFEACALSKMTIDGHTKYVMTYARRGLSGEPWGTTSALKAYATADNPLGPYTYGGPLVFAGGEIVNGGATFYTHNTHGNLFEVNGQWYISYHRATNNHGYSRQAMVEPVYPYWDDANNKLVIPMAEVTSQGFQINGLDPYKTYSAGYTNYTTPVSNGPYVSPNITGRSATNYPTDNTVVNLVNNALIGYKYFNFAARVNRQTYFTADFTPSGQTGAITVFIGNPDKASDNAKQIGVIDITSAMPQVSTQFKIPTPLLDDKANAGKYPLFLRFTSSSGSLGTLNYIGFSQEEPPIPEGLVAWYKLDETSGMVAKDSSGNGKDADVVGTPNWDPDGGFVFSGGANNSSGNAIKIPNDILAGLDDVSVTFDVLVQPHTYSNVSCFTLGNATAQTGYLTMRPNYFSGNANATWAQFANTNTTTYTAQKTSSWLPRNVWKSVAVTLKGGDTSNLGRLILYDDGVAAGSATNVAQKPPAASSANYIGRSYTTTPSFKGIIRNFRIYGRELTAEEVAALAEPIVMEGITADAEAIDLGNISAVAANLTLPASGVNSTTITWATSDASVITADGVITRPASGSSSATLTATISRGGLSKTQTFPITVMAVGDAADAAWDAGVLEVVNPDDIRGNITLPQTGKLGSAIKWSCSSPGVITPTGVVTRPAYGESAVSVVLTATATKGSAAASKSFNLTVKPMPRSKPYTAYAMSLFKTNNYEGEKFYLHVSDGNNGLSFSAVNGGAVILESYMGTMGIRDPFIIRSHDGDKFYMLATDMSYPRFGNWTLPSQKGSRCLVCFESDDLIHWSDERLCMVSPDNVGNSWAPEALYMDSIGAYVVYWASKIYDNATDPNHTTTQNNRMFYSITRDFVNFTEPTEWFYEPGFNRIDTTAIKEGDTFYRFVKDDAASTNTSSPVTSLDVFNQKSNDFFAVPYTAWTNITEEIGRQALGGTRFSTGYEGPSIIKANPGDVNGDIYYLYLDRYIGSPGGICVCTSDSLDAAKWTGRTMTIPANSHHATVIALKQSERDALAGLAPVAVTSTTSVSFDKASYLATATVKASDGGQVAGTVVFSAGSWSGTAKLNADGVATIFVPDGAFSADGSVKAVYQGFGEVSGSEASVQVTFGLSFSASMSVYDGTASVFADVFAGGQNGLAASVIAAAYNPAGQLIAVSEKTLDLPVMGREIVPLSLDVSKASDDYTVKAFLWDKATWAPLAGAVEVEKVKDPLVSSTPETYCNPINISYRFQVDQSNPARWYRAIADTQPVFYKGEYWIFPTCASGYFYSDDLINWKFVLSSATNIDAYAPAVFVLGDYLYISRSGASPLYRSNNPHSGSSWTQVRTTSYQDPYYYMDPDTGRLFALTGCAGLTTTSQVAIRIVELDTTSPTLAAKPVDTSKPGATSAGYAVNYLARNIHGYEVPGQLNDNYAATAQSWLEGSGMIKHDGKYYVYYCGPGTEYAGYCDACYVADDPLGPYTWCDNGPFAYKSTGFTMGAAHGHDIYEQTTGRLWKFGTIAISNSNIFERRLSMYPVNFNSKGQPETDLSFADYPMYVPLSPKSSYENQGPGWSQLSFGAAATASSTYDITVTSPAATGMAPFHITPGAAFDESIRTWWSAQTGEAGEWIIGDLGKVCTVRAAQVNFADQDAARISTSQPAARAYEGVYRYLFEYSVDGENWYTIADRSDAVNPANSAQDYSHDYYELVTGIPMRYVRVANKGPVPANGKFAISDIRLFGDGGGSAPDAVNNFTLSRVAGRDNRSVQVSWDPVDKADGGYVGYIVRFGVDPNDLNIHYQTINNTSVTIPILSTYTDQTMSKPVEYYFRIDTYNNSGVTVGTNVIKLQ